jgi:hypothetical protein
MLVMLPRQPVKSQRFVDVLFNPAGELGIFARLFGEPGGQIATRFGEVTPVVQPAQLLQADNGFQIAIAWVHKKWGKTPRLMGPNIAGALSSRWNADRDAQPGQHPSQPELGEHEASAEQPGGRGFEALPPAECQGGRPSRAEA